MGKRICYRWSTRRVEGLIGRTCARRSADDLAILDEAFEHSINERHNTVVVVSNDI